MARSGPHALQAAHADQNSRNNPLSAKTYEPTPEIPQGIGFNMLILASAPVSHSKVNTPTPAFHRINRYPRPELP